MNQWVEASAGSGKTTDLIGQVLDLLKRGQARLPDIVAITFTEKAAGELKLKVREKLEQERLAAEGKIRGRLDQAVLQLEQAHFQTIHGFCQELLQERPVEACIDPLFTILSKGEADRLFRDCFNDWFVARLQAPPPGLARLLRRRFPATDWQGRPTGVRGKLEDLARQLRDHRDQPRGWSFPPAFEPGVMEQFWNELLGFEESVPPNPYKYLQTLWKDLKLIIDEGPTELEAPLCRCRKALKDLAEPASKPNPSNHFAGLLYDWKLRLDAWGQLADADLMAHMRQELESVLQDYEERKQRLGRLDFVDLLLHARTLLRSDLLGYFQQRHRFLFVDEFQDTDPIQADIVNLLSQGADGMGRGLYIVGDPKQAIYRFRRGDLAVYAQVKEGRADLRARSLNNNYRSVPNLVHFFNQAFRPVFQADDYSLQADFEAMQPQSAGIDSQPSLVVLPLYTNQDPDKIIHAYKLREDMATKTASFLAWLIGESGWQVRDNCRLRPIRSQDVCLLFRSLSQNLAVMASALDLRGVPHLALSGRGLHAREEVHALRTALEAVEWPLDSLSVFATLRGPLFGFEETDLSPYFQRYGHFNPLQVEEEGPLEEVKRALRLLAELHQERNRRPAGATLERLLAASGARLHISLWPQGSQCLANLSRIVRLAWSFEAAGASSFRAFVEHLNELAEGDSESEGLSPDSGVEGVRLLTVHSSKGLEFPVVVLADPQSRQLGFEVSRASHPESHLFVCGLDDLRPLEFAQLAEREEAIQRAESDRLAYVAATRARDLLVVPGVGGATARASWLNPVLEAVGANLEPLAAAAGAPAFGPARGPRNLPKARTYRSGQVELVWWDENLLLVALPAQPAVEQALLFARDGQDQAARAASESWRQQNRDLRAQASASLQILPATLATSEGDVEVVSVGQGPSGLALGRKLHRLLAVLPFGSTRSEVDEMAGDLAERIWAVLSSPLWREGWREVPLSVPSKNGEILEGVADLVFQDETGYTVVDFKSDGERVEYRRQLAGFAMALRQATGMPVRAVMALI